MACKEDDRVQGSLESGTAGPGENLGKGQGLGVQRGGRETVRADSRLLVLFSDGGDMGRGVGRKRTDWVWILRVYKSLWSMWRSVFGAQEGDWA